MSSNSVASDGNSNDLSETSGLQVRDAPAPFNKPSADLILRTVDHIDFRVRRAILLEASSFFEDMFSLPSASGEIQENEGRVDLKYKESVVPVVPVAETSRTLENLLRFCYPVANPKLRSAIEVCTTLEAARKYLMDQVMEDIREQFASCAEREPFVLYALSTQHKWKVEMRVAAKASLSQPFTLGTLVPQMEFISAGDYVRLQVYHKACADAAATAILQEVIQTSAFNSPQSISWRCSVMQTYLAAAWFTCIHRPEPYNIFHPSFVISKRKTMKAVPWILQLLQDLQQEVRNRPRGSTVLESALVHTIGMRACSEGSCSLQVAEDVQDLCKSLASAIDAAVSQVRSIRNSVFVRVNISMILPLSRLCSRSRTDNLKYCYDCIV